MNSSSSSMARPETSTGMRHRTVKKVTRANSPRGERRRGTWRRENPSPCGSGRHKKRRPIMWRLSIIAGAVLVLQLSAAPAAAQPLAEKYLVEGKLTEGEKALQKRLEDAPTDDEARFGLGVVQILRAFERLGGSMYQYGFRADRACGGLLGFFGFLGSQEQLRELWPANPHPEKVNYAAWRKVQQASVDDLNKAEATLAGVKGRNVMLPLHVARIRVDLTGQGKAVSAVDLLGRLGDEETSRSAENVVVGFDRADVSWLRSYCHFLAACGELGLAVDAQELFDCSAHLFFEKVESPHPFLQEDRPKDRDQTEARMPPIADVIAFVHLTRLPIKEPKRCQVALEHLEAMVAQGKEMWKFILEETDDDNEWVPGPKQKGVLGITVTDEMVETWLDTLDEVELVLQGKRLIPF